MPRQRELSQRQALATAAAGGRAVTRHAGRRLAVVPLTDLVRLEQLDEDDQLARIGDAAWAEFVANGEPTRPLADLQGKLGR